MAERSKRICLYNEETAKNINQETLKLFQKYQIDMSIRDLSGNTVKQYNSDLMQWFIYMHDNQFNLSVLEATEDDITEYYYWRKQQGRHGCQPKFVWESEKEEGKIVAWFHKKESELIYKRWQKTRP